MTGFVWGTESFMGRSMKNSDIIEPSPIKCTICERSFLYLQDDYPPERNISRCMECYGRFFGLEHLMEYLKEIQTRSVKSNFPFDSAFIQFLWETPTSNPRVKEELEKRGYTYSE